MIISMTTAMTSAIQTAFPGLLGFGFPGGYEWIILLVLGLLIFGRRLPEVGRSLGKSIVEFKKGIRDVKDDVDTQSRLSAPRDAVLEHKPEPVRPEAVDQKNSAPNDVAVAGEPKQDD